MLLEMLAAAAVAAAPEGKVVSPVVVSPAGPKPPVDATIDVNGDDTASGQAVLVWPRRAFNRGAPAHVVLSCRVDVHGLAEWCKVASERPEGQGFGDAALQLRPTFKLSPVNGPDGPMAAMMNIAVEFKPPAAEFDMGMQTAMPSGEGTQGASIAIRGNPIQMREVTMMNHPVWISAPSFDEVAAAYPARAKGVEGYAVAHCEVERAGMLRRCVAAKELPTGLGFGKAAVSLAPKFRVAPEVMAKAPHGAPIEVDIPIRFTPPGEDDRTVTAPAWIAAFDPEIAPKVFPPEAAARGLTSGRGQARCAVAVDGTLSACTPEPADPDGLGFSEAAVKLASTMRMNLWSADAGPVAGGVVHVPIRLNLDATKAAQ